jgi:arylsulfatase A-like enzyme
VLFISIDDFRPEIGCYGNTMAKTPHIDRIAKAGMIFGRAYCQQVVCSPAYRSRKTWRAAVSGLYWTTPNNRGRTPGFSQYPRRVGQANLMGYSMRTDRYRLTRWLDSKNHNKVAAMELYDLQSDPQENTNIAGDPAQKAVLEKLIKRWTAGWQGDKPKDKATSATPKNAPDKRQSPGDS